MTLMQKIADVLRDSTHQVLFANIADAAYCEATKNQHSAFDFASNEAAVRYNQVGLIAASEFAFIGAMSMNSTTTPTDDQYADALIELASAEFYTEPLNYQSAAGFTHAVWMGLQAGRGVDRLGKPFYVPTPLLDKPTVDLDVLQIRAGAKYLVDALGLAEKAVSNAA